MNATATRTHALTEGNRLVRLLPLAVAVVVPFVVHVAPAWLLMWLTAGAIWIGCKCAVGPALADLRTVGLKRFVAAVFVFDVRPYLTTVFYRVGYQITNVVFALLPLVFLWAALKGGAP